MSRNWRYCECLNLLRKFWGYLFKTWTEQKRCLFRYALLMSSNSCLQRYLTLSFYKVEQTVRLSLYRQRRDTDRPCWVYTAIYILSLLLYYRMYTRLLKRLCKQYRNILILAQLIFLCHQSERIGEYAYISILAFYKTFVHDS